MSQRQILGFLLLVMLAAVVGPAITNPITISRLLHPAAAEREQVEEVARQSFGPDVDPVALDRARVEITRTDQGWQVLFQDAWVSCGQLKWPDACGFGAPRATPLVYRDLRVCIAGDGRPAYEFGASPRTMSAAEHPCRPPTPPVAVS